MPDIEVVVRKSKGVEGALQTSEAQATGESNVDTNEKGKTNTTQKAVNGALLQVGKTLMNQGISQYGNLTGNYYASEVINAVTSIGTDLATIAVAGPAGAVLVAGKYAVQMISSGVDQARKTQEHNYTIERLGQISTKGSRY